MPARVIDLSARKVIEGYVLASAITDIYYLAYKTIRDRNIEVSYIVTRNKKDYLSGDIAIVEPQEFSDLMKRE